MRDQLAGPGPWHRLEHLGEVGSTNDVATRRVAEGAVAGLVVVADRQTAGRGRLDRSWESPEDPDASLLVSFLSGVPPRGRSLVPLAAGLAVGDALCRAGADVALKWPNDVLVDHDGGERKCAGILVEHHAAAGERPAHLVVGIGINLDWRGVERDTETAAWGSVAEATGDDVDRWDVLADLMRSLGAWMRDVPEHPERLLGSYTSRCRTLGRGVQVATPGGTVTGRAVRITGEGALVVDTGDGPVVVTAGDVVHVRPRPE